MCLNISCHKGISTSIINRDQNVSAIRILSRVLSDYRRGFGLDIGFIDHFNTHVTILHYSAIANFHTLQNHAESFPVRSVFASTCLITASNSGYFSASVLKYSLNGASLPTASSSVLLYDWRFTTNHFVLVTSPLRFTTSNFIFQLNTCDYSSYATSSLTRGWVCRLQLLLVLASAIILRSESRGTHDHILLSQIGDSLNLEG
jgi:hypothetical protein